jgi:hypothetical protein
VPREIAPLAYGLRRDNTLAKITGQGNVIVVAHREMIDDVLGSASFGVRQFAINPGLGETFPWLSVLARNFEKYRFRKLKFEFESAVSTVIPGMTMLTIDMDAKDDPPATKQVFMAYEGATRANVWQPHATIMPEQAPALYVRNGPAPNASDLKTYDVGNCFFGTSGEPDSTIIGEIYVQYEVELHIPQLLPPTTLAASVVYTSDTQDFIGATSVGNLPSQIVDANTLAVFCEVGSCFQITVTTAATTLTGAAGIALPTLNGSSGTEGNIRDVTQTNVEALISEFVTVTGVTNNTSPLGPGWFIIDFNANTSGGQFRFNVAICRANVGSNL